MGRTGNAAGKPGQLHYSIFTLIPYPRRYRAGPQGLLRPFFLNSHLKPTEGRGSALTQG